MARNEQLIRQHKILQILERVRYGKTLEELRDDLVDELGLMSIHTRTVRRDLEALQAAGIDVDAHDTQRGKVWKLGPRYRQTHRISASATELIALSLGRDLMFPLAGTPFWIGIESFWNKIREELPEPVLDHYRKYRR
ncbi:MAG TPA: WYL domain-containing protein, partial [Pirellulaceae bacterium]|nr:WYL domain-containing protein [Pirellulaceae bacterium]